MTRTKKRPFHDKDIHVQVRKMRAEAMQILTVAGVDLGGELLPRQVLDLANLPDTLDGSLRDELIRLHAVSYSLGIAIGQLAPWIGTRPSGGAR
jgi:hypothetical protein